MSKPTLNLKYPVTLEPAEEGGFVVTFADVQEAITHGQDEADALMHAADALETALEFYTDAGEALRRASARRPGQSTVRPSDKACIALAEYHRLRG